MPSHSQTPREDRIEQQRTGLRILYLIVFGLITVGVFNVYSSTVYRNIEGGLNPYSYVFKQLVFLIPGMFLFYVVKKIKPETLARYSGAISLFSCALLVLVFAAGKTVNGATRWIGIGPVSIQPSEVAKIPAIMWAAWYLSRLIDGGKRITVFGEIKNILRRGNGFTLSSLKRIAAYFKPMWMPFCMAFLVILQPDMGTAGMILIFPALMYVIAGMSVVEIILGLIGAVSLFLVLALSSTYRRARLVVLWDPFSRASDLGYQTVQSLIAVGTGGIFGQGPGQGFSKFFYLPESHTDFAFAVWCQECGLFGALLIVATFMLFIYTGLRLAARVNTTYRMLLVSGLTLLIGTQACINIAMVIGCFPVTGIPLPFISYGGTSLVINLTAVGMIAGAVEHSRKEEEMQQRRALAEYGPSFGM